MFNRFSQNQLTAIIMCAVVSLSACEEKESTATAPAPLSIDMSIPDSLTGGEQATSFTKASSNQVSVFAASTNVSKSQSSDVPCAFIGADNEEDPFRNGYVMTKFMVQAVATWTCISDTIIALANEMPQDGTIVEAENDTQAIDYDPEDPTHYSITSDSASQTTARLYYGFDRAIPPSELDLPGLYLSWDENDDVTNGDHVQGKLIIDLDGLNKPVREADEPILMRMDFDQSSTQKLANMYIKFDEGNVWADGFRIEVSKDLTASLLQQVFTAKGMMNMKTQFLLVDGVAETPDLRMYTVSDAFGEGAAIAEFSDVAVSLLMNESNHLGNYIFSKEDKYFFDSDQSSNEPWDYINKSISSAAYRGSRNTAATGGAWVPFDPSLDLIIAALQLDADYFTGTACANINDDCTVMLNAVFLDGFAEQEQNQGSDPQDWRSDAINSATYLDSVYPNGQDWMGAFSQEFTPN